MMDKIGTAAGEIWRFLNEQTAPVSVIKLKTKLSFTNSLTHLALGWLARENKIIIEERNNVVFVSLKK